MPEALGKSNKGANVQRYFSRFSLVWSLKISWAKGGIFLYLIAHDEFPSINLISSSTEGGSEQLLLLHLLPLIMLQTHDCFHSSQTAVAEYSAARHLIFCIESVIPSYGVLAGVTSDRGTRVCVVKIYQGWSLLFSFRWRGEKCCWYGQVNIKRQIGSKDDCRVRNACPHHRGLGAGKRADEAEPIPVWLGRVWQMPSLPGRDTTRSMALHRGKQFANCSGIPQRGSVTGHWFCYGGTPMKPKKCCASSTSQEREMKSIESTTVSKSNSAGNWGRLAQISDCCVTSVVLVCVLERKRWVSHPSGCRRGAPDVAAMVGAVTEPTAGTLTDGARTSAAI